MSGGDFDFFPKLPDWVWWLLVIMCIVGFISTIGTIVFLIIKHIKFV